MSIPIFSAIASRPPVTRIEISVFFPAVGVELTVDKRNGRGLCPRCGGEFVVELRSGAWCCRSGCGSGPDIYSYEARRCGRCEVTAEDIGAVCRILMARVPAMAAAGLERLLARVTAWGVR